MAAPTKTPGDRKLDEHGRDSSPSYRPDSFPQSNTGSRPVHITPLDSSRRKPHTEKDKFAPNTGGSSDDISLSPQEKAEKENALNANLWKGTGASNNTKNSGKDKVKSRSVVRKRVRSGAIGAIATIMIGLGGGAGLWMIGPGQLVMFAEVFKDFAFGGWDDQQDELTTGMSRRLLFNDADAGERRLSLAGRKTLRHLTSGLEKSNGITFDTTGSTGDLQGISKNGELIADLSDSALSERGVRPSAHNRERRIALRDTLRNNGVSRLGYYSTYRPLMQSRYRIGFSIFGNLDRRARLRANEWFEKNFKQSIQNGDPENRLTGTGTELDEDATPEERAAAEQQRSDLEAAEAGNEANQELKTQQADDILDGASPSATQSKLKARLKAGLGGAASILAIGCTLKALKSGADNIAYTQRVVPFIRLANKFFIAGSQVMSGDIGALQEVGEATSLLNSPAQTATDTEGQRVAVASQTWIDSRDSRRAVGLDWQDSPGMGQDLYPSPNLIKQGLDNIIGLFDRVPGISLACEAAGSTIGQIVTGVVDFVTGPFTAAASTAFMSTYGDDLVNKLVIYMAGPDLDITSFGPYDYAGATSAGGILAKSAASQKGGGWRMTAEQANSVRAQHVTKRRQEFAKLPIMERLFNYSSPDSFITQTAFRVPKNSQQTIAYIKSAPIKMLEKISSIFIPNAYAQSCSAGDPSSCLDGFDNYGIEEFGFTQQEIDTIKDYDFDYLIDWYQGNQQENGQSNPYGTPLSAEERSRYDVCFDTDWSDPASGDMPDRCNTFDEDGDFQMKFRGARAYLVLTSGIACLDDQPECPADSSGSSSLGGSSPSSLPTGESSEIARQILDSGKVTGAARYMQQIEGIANGSGTCPINPTILSLILQISRDHEIYITSLNRKCTETLTASGVSSYHYREGGGHAVDIGRVDGVGSTGRSPTDIALLRNILPSLPAGSGIGQSNCSGASSLTLPSTVTQFTDSCNHIHIQVPVR